MMTQQIQVTLKPKNRGFHLVTDEILDRLPDLPKIGLLHVFIKHTSAGLTINENADPTVRDDFEMMINKIVPENDPDYKHTLEGPDDMPAHIKSSMMGSSVSVPITNHQLNTGTWQGIYLCEFRNSGGARKLVVTITGD
nr:secondary thiamine-phosphate synthase enzyme YjbQ [Salibacter halophilus]